MTGAEAVVRRHVDAFNAADLEALLACFAADATWVTGTDSFRGRDELREDLPARTDHIAGFYRVEDGLITAATIYREGSASI